MTTIIGVIIFMDIFLNYCLYVIYKHTLSLNSIDVF